MNTPVNFKIAKLLKEKGFDEECRLCVEDGDERPLPFNCGNTIHRNSLHPYYSAPTIAEVVMWLYENHGIWIQAPFSHNDIKPFCWIITTTKRNISEEDEDKNCWLSGIDNDNIEGYNSPTEAYEAAINYTLNNLI